MFNFSFNSIVFDCVMSFKLKFISNSWGCILIFNLSALFFRKINFLLYLFLIKFEALAYLLFIF